MFSFEVDHILQEVAKKHYVYRQDRVSRMLGGKAIVLTEEGLLGGDSEVTLGTTMH